MNDLDRLREAFRRSSLVTLTDTPFTKTEGFDALVAEIEARGLSVDANGAFWQEQDQVRAFGARGQHVGPLAIFWSGDREAVARALAAMPGVKVREPSEPDAVLFLVPVELRYPDACDDDEVCDFLVRRGADGGDAELLPDDPEEDGRERAWLEGALRIGGRASSAPALARYKRLLATSEPPDEALVDVLSTSWTAWPMDAEEGEPLLWPGDLLDVVARAGDRRAGELANAFAAHPNAALREVLAVWLQQPTDITAREMLVERLLADADLSVVQEAVRAYVRDDRIAGATKLIAQRGPGTVRDVALNLLATTARMLRTPALQRMGSTRPNLEKIHASLRALVEQGVLDVSELRSRDLADDT